MNFISMFISVNTPIGIATQIDTDIDMNFISILQIDMNVNIHISKYSYRDQYSS